MATERDSESTLWDLRKCQTEAIRDRGCCKEILDATVEDFDEMGRTYEAEYTTFRVELKQRSPILSAQKQSALS